MGEMIGEEKRMGWVLSYRWVVMDLKRNGRVGGRLGDMLSLSLSLSLTHTHTKGQSFIIK